MKTTIEIADALLEDAKALAQREGTTIRELVEQGLRRVLDERTSAMPFRLRDASVKGDGLTKEAQAREWDAIREMIYEGHGG